MMASVSDPRDTMVQLDERLLVVALADASQHHDVAAVDLHISGCRFDAEFWRRTTAVACHWLAKTADPNQLADWRAQAVAEAAGGGTPKADR